MAFLTGWTYRKAITLSRASGAVTNYQMKLLVGESSGATGEDVDCAAHVKTDFSDLRFTAADGTTLLDYWIESVSGTTPNQLATVWIEFDSIGTGATTFYMYYGNAAATAVSSGANTFITYDDFERGSNGNEVGGAWTEVQGQAEISTEQAYRGTRSAKLVGAATAAAMECAVTKSDNISVRCRIYKEDAAILSITHGDGTNRMTLQYDASENINVYDGASFVDTTANITPDAWQLMEVNDFVWATPRVDVWHNNTKIKDNADISFLSGVIANLFRFIGDGNAGRDCWVDDFIVRNYRTVEPAWGSWGAEENNIQHYTLALESASFSMTGVALRLLNNKKIIASPGAFSMIGKDMGIPKSYPPFSLEPGSFAMVGADLSIRRPVSYMRMDPGSYQVNGAPVDIKYSWYDGEAAANYQFRKQRRTF